MIYKIQNLSEICLDKSITNLLNTIEDKSAAVVCIYVVVDTIIRLNVEKDLSQLNTILFNYLVNVREYNKKSIAIPDSLICSTLQQIIHDNKMKSI